MRPVIHVFAMSAVALVFAAAAALADDWNNAGGNSGRNGQTTEIGPDAATPLWSGGRPSIIAWQPVTEGHRAFMVRQTGFPPEPNSDESPVVAMDMTTGSELWAKNIPANPGDWTTWIAGARDGKVYVSRSGNGASVSAVLYALDAANNGNIIWDSDALINSGAYDGVVFAENGDLIVGNFTTVMRIRAADGTTAWSSPRVCNVSSSCGPAVFGDSVYLADAAVGGNVIKRYDINTGQFLYASPVMTGFTLQNTPMVGPDGTIYLSRTQNNAATDFFYAWTDTGAALTLKWSVPARWTTSSEFAVGPDGSVYMMGAENRIQRLNPDNGSIVDTSEPILLDNPTGNCTPRFAVDALGRLFFSNGQFANGRLYSFDADLTERWHLSVPSINIGGPAIGQNGVLLVCGVGTNVKAYFTEHGSECIGDVAPSPAGDGVVNVDDLFAIIGAWGTSDPQYDIAPLPPKTSNGTVDIDDLFAVIAAWGACP